jgi:hypothetical protein
VVRDAKPLAAAWETVMEAPAHGSAPGGSRVDRQQAKSTAVASFYSTENSTASTADEPRFDVALVAHKKADVHERRSLAWSRLAQAVTTHKAGEKDGPGWLPARIEPGPRRGERVLELSLLVLDVEADCERLPDDRKRVVGPLPPTLQEMAAELKRRRIAAILATSHSHEAPAADGGTLGPRYRLVIWPSRPIKPAEVKPLGLHVASVLGFADALDVGCLEPARLYYGARCPEERLRLAKHAVVEGEPLDVDAMLRDASVAEAGPPAPSYDGGGDVIKAFNAAHDVGAILERHGYVPAGRNRWMWPKSTTGMAGVVRLPNSGRVFSHHPGDPLSTGHGHDAFSAWCTLEHGGSVRDAVREAARILGMERPAGRQTTVAGGPTSPAWPELDPLPEPQDEVPQAFPFDGLGPILGAAARAIADAVQAPDALAAGSVLGAAAVAAQAHADVLMPHGQRAPLSLYVVTSAGSGDRKSATDQVAMRAIEERRLQDHRRYAAARAAYAEATKSQKPGEGAPPAPQSIVVSSGTVEGLQQLLRKQSHVGLFSPEGAEVFGGHSMREERRQAGIAALCKAWAGETLDTLTKGEGLHVLAGRRVTMHVLLQPVVARALLADPLAHGQGLLARTLMAEPCSLAGTRFFNASALPAHQRPQVQRYEASLRDLLKLDLPLQHGGDGFELQPRVLDMTPEARGLWIAFYDACEAQQKTGGPLAGVRAWASKAAEQAARLAGVRALAENCEVQAIGGSVMDGAIQVAGFYLLEHVRLLKQGIEHLHAQRLRDLLDWLQKRGTTVEHAAVLQYAPRALRDLKAEGLSLLLDELVQRGYIRRRGSAWEVRPS